MAITDLDNRQFGNMLVLSATYHNKYLKVLIDQERFQKLLTRTIGFLRRLGPISPTCAIDCAILEKINKALFGVAQQYKNPNEIYSKETDPASASNSFSAKS